MCLNCRRCENVTVQRSHSSVSSTISNLSSTPLTAAIKLFHACKLLAQIILHNDYYGVLRLKKLMPQQPLTTLASLVSVKYVHGGLNLDGFLTALVLTPLAVADTLERRPSLLNCLFKYANHKGIVRNI